jgi:hypothetical protein
MEDCCSVKKEIIATKPSVLVGIFLKLKVYQPLLVIVLLVLFASAAISISTKQSWMPLFMGLFLLIFSMLKLFDVKGFATSFAMYDILAMRSGIYAKSYPFIELALALAYLGVNNLYYVNITTALLMTIGLFGIINTKLKKLDIKCACMGSFIDVPVGYVTIVENSAMLIMAALMLAH